MNLASLPALGTALEGGIFRGVITKKDGTHCAVVRLPEIKKDVTWQQAKAWAEEQGGELPSKSVAALLASNEELDDDDWYWTGEELNASYAWQFLSDGYTYDYHKSYEGSAVCVRLIPLTA